MEAQVSERGSRLTPARLLLGSLIGGAGIAILGFFWSASPASAAEPPPQPAPVGHSLVSAVGSAVSGIDHAVTGAVDELGDTAAAVTSPVVHALPAPVQQAVEAVATPVVAPVTEAVESVAASSPVSQVVAPVAAAVDHVVNSVPVAHELLGDDPVGTVTAPVSGLVDHAVVAVVDSATDAIDPVFGIPAPPVTPTAPGDAAGQTPGAALGQSSSSGASGTQFSASSTGGVSPGLTVDGALGARSGVGSPGSPPGAPPTPGDRAPGGQPAVMSGSVSSSGAGASGAVALTEKTFNFGAAGSGTHAQASDDDVPSSPVADHDISPD